MSDQEASDARRRNLSYAASKQREATAALLDELRKPADKWDEGIIDKRRGDIDRWTMCREIDLQEALGDSCKRLRDWDVDGIEWIATEPAPVPGLVRTGKDERTPLLVPAGKVGFLVAPGGAGKTQALTQLALSVASGMPWFGKFGIAKPGPVLLVLGEEDESEMRRRIQRAARAPGADLVGNAEGIKAAVDNLWTMPRYGLPSRLTDDKEHRSLFGADLVDYLEGANVKWSCIILDPGARFMGAEAEKDNAAATRFIEAVEDLTKSPGNPTVIVAHHVSKGAMRAEKTDQGAARGASALVDGARFVLELREDLDLEQRDSLPAELRCNRFPRLLLTKTNYGPPVEPVRLAVTGEGVRLATENERGAVDGARNGQAGKGKLRADSQRETDDPFADV